MGAQQKLDNDLKLLNDFHRSHEKALDEIQKLDSRMDHLAPYEIGKLQYLYTKAERQAWNIAAWHKKKQKYYEGMAEIAQGQEYKQMRDSGKTGTDAQYLSRISKGAQLTEAAKYEGDYITWRGIAQTYEGARLALKDILKSIEAQGGS
ncbi:hypothetical protein D5F11_021515 [Siminovitchia terrae]|uniref:Uncharacterized protein n=1 Tax=Siminovitchia terrae TaxID=1914933 RepID=A0A429X2D9_SIMTE|nr:hypothetical protein [Siminovitchia terrae]RST57641.1 hypothetical protein D5F11_021515 [Siminovitchia terrae]